MRKSKSRKGFEKTYRTIPYFNEKPMDAQSYISQLKEYSKQFEVWWCKPYEEFHKNYQKQNSSFISRLIPIIIETREGTTKYTKAVQQFEKETKEKYDLVEEIYNFLDANYEAYLHATDEQRIEIRSVISQSFYPTPKTSIVLYLDNYMVSVFFDYVRKRVVKELRSTGDKPWLVRGLVAISMVNGAPDYRDTLINLGDLYIAAQTYRINPQPIFQEIAEISSHENLLGGSPSLKEIMANINDSNVREIYGHF